MEEEIDIKEIIIALWKRKIAIIITTVVFGLCALLFFGIIKDGFNTSIETQEQLYYAKSAVIIGSTEQTKTYQLSDSDNDPYSTSTRLKINIDPVLLSTYKELIKTRTSLESIVNELALPININALSNAITLSQKNESNVLEICVAYNDSEKVIEITNKLIENFAKTIQDVYVVDTITILDSAYLLTDAEIYSDANLASLIPTSIAKANVKHTMKYTVIASILGFIVSVGVVLLLEMLNNTIKDEESLEKETELRVITKITKTNSSSKNFDMIKTSIGDNKTIIITSPEPEDGKTFVATNLAKSFAKSSDKVLLIDLTSNSSDMLEKYNGKGLNDFIKGRSKDLTKFINKTSTNNLDILLSGSASDDSIESKKLEELINSIKDTYDSIIIDSQNILDSANTLAITKVTKNVILVATERKTNLTNFIKAKSKINDVDGNIIGSILLK